jgi:predicted transcriptional regulator
MLKRLEDKGYVSRSESERGYLYSPTVSDTVAKKSALSEIVRVFFNGSPASAASALLGMSDKLKDDELSELEQMIARARKAKGDK